MARRFRLSFVVPLLRGNHAPEYAARGVAVGIFWAFTPLIPFQIYLLGMTWIALRRWSRLDFHPLVALAWVFVTNALTMLPVYFIFYLTGQLMLGHAADPMGYAVFQDEWTAVAHGGWDPIDAARAIAALPFGPFGTALAVGCLPYSLGGAWLGYAVSVRALRRATARRRERTAKPSPLSEV